MALFDTISYDHACSIQNQSYYMKTISGPSFRRPSIKDRWCSIQMLWCRAKAWANIAHISSGQYRAVELVLHSLWLWPQILVLALFKLKKILHYCHLILSFTSCGKMIMHFNALGPQSPIDTNRLWYCWLPFTLLPGLHWKLCLAVSIPEFETLIWN